MGDSVALTDQHAHADRRALDLRDRRAQVIANALGLQLPEDHRGEVGILAREDRRCDVDDGHHAAQTAERLRHLAADRPAAHDDQVRHRLAQIEHRLVREVGHGGETRNRRHRGPRSGGDHDAARADAALADVDRVTRGKASAAEDHVDAETAKPLRTVGRLDLADDRRDPFHHARELGPRVVRRERKAVGVAHRVGDPRRLEQRFRRHAAIPQAVAAELVLFDQRDLGAQRRAAGRDDQAAGAAADHRDIEVGLRHVTSRCAVIGAFLHGAPVSENRAIGFAANQGGGSGRRAARRSRARPRLRARPCHGPPSGATRAIRGVAGRRHRARRSR